MRVCGRWNKRERSTWDDARPDRTDRYARARRDHRRLRAHRPPSHPQRLLQGGRGLEHRGAGAWSFGVRAGKRGRQAGGKRASGRASGRASAVPSNRSSFFKYSCKILALQCSAVAAFHCVKADDRTRAVVSWSRTASATTSTTASGAVLSWCPHGHRPGLRLLWFLGPKKREHLFPPCVRSSTVPAQKRVVVVASVCSPNVVVVGHGTRGRLGQAYPVFRQCSPIATKPFLLRRLGRTPVTRFWWCIPVTTTKSSITIFVSTNKFGLLHSLS